MKLLIMAVALLWAGTADALMREVPIEDAVANAADIVAARVVDRVSHHADDGRTIVTDVQLEIASVLKGGLKPGQRIIIRTLGGEVGEFGMWVEHQPVFERGEQTVVFLRATNGDLRELQHLEQGKFCVVGDRAIDFRGRAKPLTNFQSEIRSLVGSLDE